MFAAKRFTLVLAVALVTLALSAASVLAQAGAPNPSGGTGLRRTVEEGTGTLSPTDFLSGGVSVDLGLRSWLGGFAPFRSRAAADRKMMAVVQQRIWRR